jgi:CRP-like cAMP-binding protein
MRTRVTDDKPTLLRSLPAFAGASRRELRELARASELALADAGRVLVCAGRRAIETYLVLEGEVDVMIDGDVVATLGPGEFVGEIGVIDGEARTADVVARTDVALLAIHATAVRSLVESSHSFRLALLRQVASRIRRMDLQLEAV